MQNDQDASRVDIEKGAQQPTATPTPVSEPHSIYTKNQKRMMVIAAAIASTFSPITGNIYLPALNSVAHDLKVSNSAATLTVTTYMVSNFKIFRFSRYPFVRSRRIEYTSARVSTVYPPTSANSVQCQMYLYQGFHPSCKGYVTGTQETTVDIQEYSGASATQLLIIH
jgi:hypothetical protein